MAVKPLPGADAVRAADRLRHDLGKAVRFSAPESVESDTGELRERLGRDVLAARSDPSGARAAASVFDAWMRESGGLFPSGPAAEALRRIASAVDELRPLAARLDGLARPELERLDALTRSIAEECRVLAASARPKGSR